MKKRKVKTGISASTICGLVFFIIGITFIPLGIGLYYNEVDKIDAIIFLFTFGGLGSIFAIVGIILFIFNIRKKIKSQKLLDDGKYIIAEIFEIAPNLTVRINGKHPYVIKCKYEENGTLHIFKTRNILYNPEGLLKGNSVKVYTDRVNYKNYYVDIDEVLTNVKFH